MPIAQVSDLTLVYVTETFPNLTWTLAFVVLGLSPVTITGNSLVLASILCDPFQNIRSAPSSYIIFNLAIADLLVGLVLEPLFAIDTFYLALSHTELVSESVIELLTYLLVGVSVCSLVYLSFDRLTATRIPLQYAYTMSKKKVLYVNISIWVYFAILAIVPSVFNTLYNSAVWLSVVVAHIMIVLVLLSILNIALVLLVRIRGRKIKRMVDSESSAVIQRAFNREKAVTRTTGITVLAFLICALPCGILSSVYLSSREMNTKLKEILTWMYFLGLFLMYINSLMNPFLYAWRLPKYRKAFGYIFNHIKNKIFAFTFQFIISFKNLSRTQRTRTQKEASRLPSHTHYMLS